MNENLQQTTSSAAAIAASPEQGNRVPSPANQRSAALPVPSLAPVMRHARLVRLAALGLVALAVAWVAGCGGSSGDGNADPARVAPKASAIYAVGAISPDGDQGAAVKALSRKLFGEKDPGKAISQAVQRAINRAGGSGKVDFEKDVKPWLGRRAAVALTQLQAGSTRISGAVIVASKDLDATRAAIKKLERGRRISKGSYRGVAFDIDRSDQSAAGVVGDFAVLGFQPDGFRAVVDASKDGGLADAQNFQAAKRRGEGKLGLAYLDVKTFVGAALQRLPADQRSAVQGALGATNLQPVTATLDAKSNAVNVEVLAQAASGANRSPQAGKAPVIAGLPGDSWAAFGIPRLGQTLATALRNFESGLGGAAIGSLKGVLTQRTGLDLDRDILAALGDVALFARGTSLLNVGGGAVVQSPSPAAARRLVSKLGAFVARQGSAKTVRTRIGGADGVKITIPRVPGAINFVVKGAKLVLAYSDPATTQALSPSTKLAQSSRYQRAAASLGGISPSLFIDFGPIASLVEGVSPSRPTPSFARAKQGLQALDTLALGARAEGGQQVVRFVLRLK
jgi:hypothetical protein